MNEEQKALLTKLLELEKDAIRRRDLFFDSLDRNCRYHAERTDIVVDIPENARNLRVILREEALDMPEKERQAVIEAVASMKAAGFTNKSIAELLRISEAVVKTMANPTDIACV